MDELTFEQEKKNKKFILEGLKGWLERLERADKEIRILHEHFRKVYIEIEKEQ